MRVAVLFFYVASIAAAQSQRELLGRVIKGDNPTNAPVAHAKVVMEESGSRDITDDDGRFRLFVPDAFRPGDEVTITVTFPGYAVYEPTAGKVRIPVDLVRTQQEIRLLPIGSPKFLSDTQLRALIEQVAHESTRQSSQAHSNETPDLSRYLKDWALRYGFSIEQVRAELDRWSAEVESRRASAYDLSLAAFAKRNFHEANERALDAAAAAEVSLKRLESQERESTDRVIRAYCLAGDAAYNALDFEASVTAYRRALVYVARTNNAVQWADLQLRIGNAEENLISRSEGPAIAAHSNATLEAYNSALKVYKAEDLPQYWAGTENNLGNALREIAERSEGLGAAMYLKQSVTAYRASLQVRTREQLPLEWAATPNNLAIALDDLGERTEGPQATAYLKQSVASLRNALQVYTRNKAPQNWAATHDNLGNTLEDLGAVARGWTRRYISGSRLRVSRVP